VSEEAIIVDRGYRPYEGPRGTLRSSMWAIVKDGYRRALGLRRRAWSKVMPWGLIALMLMITMVVIAVAWFAGDLIPNLPSYAEYFDLTSQLGLLFVALTGPLLLVPDRVNGVLAVYMSRPLRMSDYLLAKAAALVSLMLTFYLVPQTILHLGLAALSDDGFFTYLGANLDVLWKVPVVALAYIATHGSIAFAVSAFLGRSGLASGLYLGFIIITTNVAGLIVGVATFPGAKYTALFALEQHPRYFRDWVFDTNAGFLIMEEAGFDAWVSLACIVAIVALSSLVVWRQYRKLP
jgi:ABC-2 type transport system permease protein